MTAPGIPVSAGSAAEFAGTAFRLALSLGMILALLVILLRLPHAADRRRGGMRNRVQDLGAKAKPCRPGLEGMARTIALARTRPHARDLLQSRLRALAIDLCESRLPGPEAEARSLVEAGDFPPGTGGLLSRDELSRGTGHDGDLIAEYESLLDGLESWADFREEKKVGHGQK